MNSVSLSSKISKEKGNIQKKRRKKKLYNMYLEVVEAMPFGYYTILKLSSWSRTWVAFSELTASIPQLNRHPKLSTNWPVIWKPRFPSNITQLLYPIPSPQYSITPEPNPHNKYYLHFQNTHKYHQSLIFSLLTMLVFVVSSSISPSPPCMNLNYECTCKSVQTESSLHWTH